MVICMHRTGVPVLSALKCAVFAINTCPLDGVPDCPEFAEFILIHAFFSLCVPGSSSPISVL